MDQQSLLNKATDLVNLSSAELIEHAIKRGEGVLSETGALITNTKKYTGRSPKDKFTVIDDITRHQVWFNDINQPMQKEHARTLVSKVKNYLAAKPCFVTECMAGASPLHSLKIRITTERAWHALFARNMFIDISPESMDRLYDFQIFHAPGFLADPKQDHTRSEVAVLIDFTDRYVVICGTEYAGEIKKSLFTVLNFLLPNKGVLSMHCSANKNADGDVAIFFGLSGTGKTTLSSEASRSLIGDDEHGWDDHGVFNFEGGCYAKVINLSEVDEPEIYHASRSFGAILENVVYDERTRKLDFDDNRFTENTRSSYDISMIPHACMTGAGGHPNNIIMLTCDAFGVLPPIAKLSAHAATYHFVNGYTAKVAGTERGIKEPEAVFSACFGAPFMAHFPGVYAQILEQKIRRHQVQCWLVNTGWSGGPYGIGNRMKIAWTRRIIQAALDGTLADAKFVKDEIFNLDIPVEIAGLPRDILVPRETWADKNAYDLQAKKLAQLFYENFKPYSAMLSKEVRESGPMRVL